MLDEVLTLTALALAGGLVLVRRTTLPGPAVAAAAPLAGTGLLVTAGTAWLAVVGTIRVVPVVATAAAMAVIASVGRSEPGGRRWWGMAAGGLSAGALASAAGAIAFTRLTPDSLDYVAMADILVEASAPESLRLFDLETRNLATSLLHTLGTVDGGMFAPGATPAIVVPGLALFAWMVRTAIRPAAGVRDRAAFWLTGAAVLLALASGRVVYDVFYVNSHGVIMVGFLAMAGAGYLAVRFAEPSWLVLAGLAAPFVMVGRPEGPLLVLIALAPTLSDGGIPLRHRLWAALPASLTGVVWFGGVVWRAHAGDVELSLLDPTVGGVAVSAALPILVAIAGLPALGRVVRWAPWGLVAALAAALVAGAVEDRALVEATVEATAVNMVGPGGWGVTWPVLFALGVLAAALPPGSHQRLLLAPAGAFLLLVLASAVLRGDPYRVGTGDSGNRMLAHGVLVVILYVVVALARAEAARGSPASGEGVT